MNFQRLSAVLVTAALALVTVETASAQPLWVDRSAPSSVALEFLKTNYSGSADPTFFTAVWFMSGRFAVNDVFTIDAQVPFSHFAVDGGEGSGTIGNPYIGAEFHNDEAGIFAEVGVYFPAADDGEYDALFNGAYTEFIDRVDAFTTDAVPIVAAINLARHEESGLVYRVRVSPVVWFATGERQDNEQFFVYSGQFGFSSDELSVLAGLSGRWYVSAEDADFSEASFHQIGFMVGRPFGPVRPALTMRVPMDEDLSDAVDFVWGINVSVDIQN